MAKFNERLRQLRTAKKLSQAEFAEQIGISKSSVNMYERGEREPNFKTLEIIADYFNVDMDYLLGKSDIPLRNVVKSGDCFPIPALPAATDNPETQTVTINERFRQARETLHKSQDVFAQEAGRTRSEIKNIEYGKTVPKEEVIKSVCRTHNIDEAWLRTGEGEMFKPKTKDDEIAEIVGKALNGSSDFKKAVVKMICSRTDSELQALAAALQSIYENL